VVPLSTCVLAGQSLNYMSSVGAINARLSTTPTYNCYIP
jgi:hypothetical protein